MPDNALIETFLGPARFTLYLDAMNGHTEHAEDLYQWNTEFGGALHSQLCHVEIMVRNAIDRALSDWNQNQGYPREWTRPQSAAPLLFAMSGDKIDEARKQAAKSAGTREHGHARKGAAVTHDDVVSQMTFGNWCALLGTTGGRARLSKAQDLWSQGLHQAFPHAHPTDNGRHYVATRMERLRKLRNRVSHHENLLAVNAENRIADMLGVLRTLGPEHPSWAMRRSRIRSIAKNDPRRSPSTTVRT
ncbi:Abi family protein [Gordonia malaquae]|uniref:Abi family protein n=1 Tax=Gordonia malaquae TaxID=410332 RepID=UPI0030192F76